MVVWVVFLITKGFCQLTEKPLFIYLAHHSIGEADKPTTVTHVVEELRITDFQ
jgi:hypothetical protein